jgi:DNA-binding protein YbaB
MEAAPNELADLILAAVNEAFDKANDAKSSAIEGLVPGAGGLR